MNIIFLDVDGVINSENVLIKANSFFSYPFDHNCLANLKELVTQARAYIVISSSRRYSEEEMQKLLNVLNEYDLAKVVIGCTPRLGLSRGEEINRFLLDFNGDEINSFVILDDNAIVGELMPYLVHINRQVGLTSEDIQKALKVLSRGYKRS